MKIRLVPQGTRQNSTQGDEIGGKGGKVQLKRESLVVWASLVVPRPHLCVAVINVINVTSCLALTVAPESFGGLLGLVTESYNVLGWKRS